jgi:hypothetical protein
MINKTTTVICDICGEMYTNLNGFTHMEFHPFVVTIGREDFEDFCIKCKPKVEAALRNLKKYHGYEYVTD